MAQARLPADLRAQIDRRGARGRGVAAIAGRHLWAGLPDAEKLLRAEGLQLFRSLRAVRRPPERPHRRRPAVPDAVEQERAAQDQRGGVDAEAADRTGALPGQDRRHGRHAHARGARRISEEARADGRLLADRGGARPHAAVTYCAEDGNAAATKAAAANAMVRSSCYAKLN